MLFFYSMLANEGLPLQQTEK